MDWIKVLEIAPVFCVLLMLFISLRALYATKKAHRYFGKRFIEISLASHHEKEIIRLHSAIMQGKQPKKKDITIYYNIANRALKGMKREEQSRVRQAIEQPSEQGRLTFMERFISSKVLPHLSH